MNVDTDTFMAISARADGMADLAEQVGALGRKVTTLTGRVTVMGNRVGHLDTEVTDRLAGLTRIISIVFGAGDRPAPKHAAARDRHGLRAITGSKR